jgi:DNA-binding winged helix-turn-helix (wHTH) protein
MAHGDRSVDVFIRKLRQKLERRSPGWGYIHTHFGVGYRFDPEPAAGTEGERALEPVRAPEPPPVLEPVSQAVHNTFTTG